MVVKLSTSQVRFREVFALIKREAGGKLLRAEIVAELRLILAPAVAEVRTGALEMRTSGLAHAGAELRQAVAGNVKVGVNASGRLTGARVYVSKKGMPRRFSNAPRDLNAPQWEHPTGRGGPSVVQVGAPGFFDKPLRGRVREYRRAIEVAVERMAKRIAAR